MTVTDPGPWFTMRRARSVVVALCVLFAACYIVPVSPEARAPYSQVILVAIIALATGASLLAVRVFAGRERLTWSFISASMGAFLVSMALRTASVIETGELPQAGNVGDIFAILGFVCLAVSAVIFTGFGAGQRHKTVTAVVDLLITIGAGCGIVILFVMLPLGAFDSAASPFGRIVIMFYPVVAITIATYALLFRRTPWTTPDALLATGLALGAFSALAASLAFSLRLFDAGGLLEGAIDLLMAIAVGAFILSVASRLKPTRRTARSSGFANPPRATQLVVHYVLGLMLLPALVHEAQIVPGALGRFVIPAGTALLAALFVTRSALLAFENRTLASQACIDPLTGLMSHARLRDGVEREILAVRRDGARFVLCCFDIAGLDAINRRYGFEEGDRVLRRLADATGSVAGTSMAARLGGDEFALLLPGVSVEDAMVICDALIQFMSSERGSGPSVALGVGIAQYPTHAETAEGLVQSARSAAEASKELGCKSTVVFDPLLIAALDRDTASETVHAWAEQHAVEALAVAVDARIPQAWQHSRRVSDLAVGFVNTLGWEQETIESVRVSAALHDIGKIAVPDHVLAQDGPHSDSERMQLERHPGLATRILGESASAEVLEAIHAHHERWDGTGFPDGLRGDEIPLISRVIALTDAYDRLRFAGASHASVGIDAAARQIESLGGVSFDPDLAASFAAFVRGSDDAHESGDEELAVAAARLLHPTLPCLVADVSGERAGLGICLAVNDLFLDTFEYAAEDLIGLWLTDIAPNVAPQGSAPLIMATEALRRGESVLLEREIVRGDGASINTELTLGLSDAGERRLLVVTSSPISIDPAARRAMDRRERKIDAVAAATRKMSENVELSEILAEGMSCAMVLTEASQSAIALVRDESLQFECLTRTGDWIHDITPASGEGISWQVISTGEPFVSNRGQYDLADDECAHLLGVLNVVAVPILDRSGVPLGAVEAHNSMRLFGEDDVELLAGLASTLAIAIQNNVALAELKRHEADLRMLTGEVAVAQERERRAIATDLHDRIGQSLQVAKLMISQSQVAPDAQEASDSLARADRLLLEAIEETRTMIRQISPPMLYDLGLEATLEWLTESSDSPAGVACRYEDDGSRKPLSDEMRGIVYRMIRELFMNAIKHSDAKTITISTQSLSGTLVAQVVDDGRGFVPDPHMQGFGLASVREQVRALGGALELESGIDEGTIARLVVPIVKSDGVRGVVSATRR